MKKTDYLSKIIDILKKREATLLENQSVGKYNRHFDKMIKYARKLLNENRQDELLPYLDDDSISIQYDVASLLYNFYPERCRAVFLRISSMSVKTGMPRQFSDIRLSAQRILEFGMPPNFP